MATSLRREQVRDIWYQSSSDPRELREGVTDSDSIQRTIIVTVYNVFYPITKDVLHQVFDPYGNVEVIHILPATEIFQALLRFQYHDSIKAAKVGLHGRNIYDGRCKLDLKYLATSFCDREMSKENTIGSVYGDIYESMKEISSTIDNLISQLNKFRRTSLEKEALQSEPKVFDQLPSKKFVEISAEKVDSHELKSTLLNEKQIDGEELAHKVKEEVSKEIFQMFDEIPVGESKEMETEITKFQEFDEMTVFRALKDSNADSFVDDVLVDEKPWFSGVQEELTRSYVLVCAHNKRDRRFGICGPILIEKIEEIESKELKNQVFVTACLRIGEHKYASNTMTFRAKFDGKIARNWYGIWRGQMGANVKDAGNKNAKDQKHIPTGKAHIYSNVLVQILFDPGGYVANTWNMLIPLNFGSIMVGFSNLWLKFLVVQHYGDAQKDEYDNGNGKLALNIFYSLSLDEALLFLLEKAYWEWKVSVENLLQSMNNECEFCDSGFILVRRFFYNAHSKCVNGSIFDGLEMVSFAIEPLDLKLLIEQFVGVRILHKFAIITRFSEDTLMQIGISSLSLNSLEDLMVSWIHMVDILIFGENLTGINVFGIKKSLGKRDDDCHHVMLYKKEDFVGIVKEITSGKGVNVVYDSVKNDTFDESLECLKIFGYMVSFGQSSNPYLNTNVGTMSPFEHKEVFVLDDSGEVDLDLGNYELFLDLMLTRDNHITTGEIYQSVIDKKKRGDYLGQAVHVVPHITDAIQVCIQRAAAIPVDGKDGPDDVCVIELGGNIGDIEYMSFIGALGQFSYRVAAGNFCLKHVSLVPVLNVGETEILKSLRFHGPIIIVNASAANEVKISQDIHKEAILDINIGFHWVSLVFCLLIVGMIFKWLVYTTKVFFGNLDPRGRGLVDPGGNIMTQSYYTIKLEFSSDDYYISIWSSKLCYLHFSQMKEGYK